MPNPAPQADKRIVDLLVSTGRLSEEQVREACSEGKAGEVAILEQIERVLSQRDRKDFLTPDRLTGRLLEAWRLQVELSQESLRTRINQEFKAIGGLGIAVSNQSSISRIVLGKQTLTYNQAMAVLRVVRQITGKNVPGEFLSAWDGEAVSQSFLPELIDFSVEVD